MKKSNEYLIGCEHDGSFISAEEVKRLIKLAQEDAIRETVKECAKYAEADYKLLDSFDRVTGEDIEAFVIESSILSVADRLIKEL